jgi:uncharacterized protein (TIGR02246 family)
MPTGVPGQVSPRDSATVVGPDRDAIQQVLTRFVAAWNVHDMRPLADLFTERADFVVVTGRHLKGRAEIVAYHDSLHRGAFRQRQLRAQWKNLRHIRPDVAIGHIAFEGWTPGDSTLRTSALATVTLICNAGRWRIEALHNLRLSGVPSIRHDVALRELLVSGAA